MVSLRLNIASRSTFKEQILCQDSYRMLRVRMYHSTSSSHDLKPGSAAEAKLVAGANLLEPSLRMVSYVYYWRALMTRGHCPGDLCEWIRIHATYST